MIEQNTDGGDLQEPLTQEQKRAIYDAFLEEYVNRVDSLGEPASDAESEAARKFNLAQLFIALFRDAKFTPQNRDQVAIKREAALQDEELLDQFKADLIGELKKCTALSPRTIEVNANRNFVSVSYMKAKLKQTRIDVITPLQGDALLVHFGFFEPRADRQGNTRKSSSTAIDRLRKDLGLKYAEQGTVRRGV